MRRKHSIKFAFCVLGLSPVLVLAAQPATQPTVDAAPSTGEVEIQAPALDTTSNPAVSEDTGKPRRQFGEGPLGRRLAQRFMPVSEKDKTDAMIFMKEHSPNRFTAIDSLPEGERKTNVKELAARNYLNWMKVMREDPELYAVILKRVAVEDDIFDLVTQLHKDSPEKVDATRAKLKDKVAALVDVGIEERRLRLKRLQKTVDEQQQKLADDSSHRDTLVSERLKTILSDEKGLVPNSGNGGTGGQHGHGGPRP
jgi:hypothetical protein